MRVQKGAKGAEDTATLASAGFFCEVGRTKWHCLEDGLALRSRV